MKKKIYSCLILLFIILAFPSIVKAKFTMQDADAVLSSGEYYIELLDKEQNVIATPVKSNFKEDDSYGDVFTRVRECRMEIKEGQNIFAHVFFKLTGINSSYIYETSGEGCITDDKQVTTNLKTSGTNGVEFLIPVNIEEANSVMTLQIEKTDIFLKHNYYFLTVNILNKEMENAEKAEKLKEKLQALAGTKAPQNVDYKELTYWIMADAWWNESKTLENMAKTGDGRKKLDEWRSEIAPHVRGGKKITKDSTDKELLSETNQLYSVTQILTTYILTDGDKKEIEDITNNNTETGKHMEIRIIKLIATITGSRKPSVFEDILDNIDGYDKPNDLDTATSGKIATVASKILTAITNVGIVVAILILAILGIKYMLGSVEEKAEYKKDLVPYIVGAFLLLGITTFVKILMQWGEQISTL